MRNGLVFLLMGLSGWGVSAASIGCTAEEARKAEAVAGVARSWSDLHETFRLYNHCDDGAVAEGFSESVTRLLADNWKTLPDLVRLFGGDADFRGFVIRHIDESAPADRLKKITRNARGQCPANLQSFCKQLREAAGRGG